MGCDVHPVCQVKKRGKWVRNKEEVFPNTSYQRFKEMIADYEAKPVLTEREAQHMESLKNWLTEEKPFETDPESGRNYDWFAVIGNVRNGVGFAGISTGLGFNFISDSRGFPEDFKPKEKRGYGTTYQGVSMGDHSFSYITLDEFLQFNWDQTTTKFGYIHLDKYKEIKDTGKSPEEWSGDISGPGIVKVTMQEADTFLKGGLQHLKDKNLQVGYKWEVKYSEWFDHKFKSWVHPMIKLKTQFSDVRIVFGFDS